MDFGPSPWVAKNRGTNDLNRCQHAADRRCIDQAKRFKELEKENARLKRLLADAELDKAMLKEIAEGNW